MLPSIDTVYLLLNDFLNHLRAKDAICRQERTFEINCSVYFRQVNCICKVFWDLKKVFGVLTYSFAAHFDVFKEAGVYTRVIRVQA